jgi:hypothetical protein
MEKKKTKTKTKTKIKITNMKHMLILKPNDNVFECNKIVV